jgi:hypothetical protein
MHEIIATLSMDKLEFFVVEETLLKDNEDMLKKARYFEK